MLDIINYRLHTDFCHAYPTYWSQTVEKVVTHNSTRIKSFKIQNYSKETHI